MNERENEMSELSIQRTEALDKLIENNTDPYILAGLERLREKTNTKFFSFIDRELLDAAGLSETDLNSLFEQTPNYIEAELDEKPESGGTTFN